VGFEFILFFVYRSFRYGSAFDQDELTKVKDCLWFVLEPLIVKNETYSFGFYKTLIERMKNHLDALEPENETVNHKMYALCDIALGLILQRSTSFEMKDYLSDPRIPPMYFKRHEDPFYSNSRSYLPPDMQYAAPKKAGLSISVVSENSKKGNRKGKREATVLDEDGNVSIDAKPMDADHTRLEIPDIEEESVNNGPAPKVLRLTRRTAAAAAAATPTTTETAEEPNQPPSGTSEDDDEEGTSTTAPKAVRVTRRTAAASASSSSPTTHATTTITVTLVK